MENPYRKIYKKTSRLVYFKTYNIDSGSKFKYDTQISEVMYYQLFIKHYISARFENIEFVLNIWKYENQY